MTASFDLNLLPIARYAGRDYPEMLGLYFSEPPRRAARGRNLDRMVLYLVFEGNAPLPAVQRDQMLSDLARLYYRSAGSITAALRSTAEELNRLLLERNRQLGANRQCVGLLVQVVLREEQVFVAQSGSTHVYLVSASGVSHEHDPELSGRGLGLSRTASVSFTQSTLKTNDALLLTALPSPNWSTDVLTGIHSQGPESLRRRLYHQTQADINAVALQVKQGKGKFYLLRPAVPSPAPSSPAPLPTAAPAAETSAPTSNAAIPLPSKLEETSAAAQPPDVVGVPTAAAIAAEQISIAVDSPANEKQIPEKAAAVSAAAAVPQAERRSTGSSAAGFLGAFGAGITAGAKKIQEGLHTFLGRMLPDDAFLNIPSSVMALIAVAVPVIVVTAASMVYFQLGRAAQYELLSSQARQVALQAMEQTDLGAKRADLGAALSLLEKSEDFATTPEAEAEIQELRVQVRSALDELDFVQRVNYQSAIVGSLPVTSNIVGMVAFDDDMYLLDSTSGGVLRAYLTDQGYELDYTFQCNPGKYSEITVGPLTEIIAWPPGYKPQAKLLASDAAGNILYCQPDQAPIAERLTPAEAEGWGNILETALDQGDFYALDLPSNGVWIYWRSNFGEQPTLFFDQEIPPLQDVRDMLVDRDDLYLLQLDGSMMLCTRDNLIVAPTTCSIKSYIDRRPGRESLPLVTPVPFIQILSTPPPDPSLYLLEPNGHAVYHFSLNNLSFQKQLLPESELPARDATSFAINNARRYIYLALGNQVYYAVMP
jgi:hypothetical protein